MKAFTDFTKITDLSGVRIVGYANNQEISISFNTLAMSVNNFILQAKRQTPMIYRFDTETYVNIKDPNTTYGIYLSSSVEQFDIELTEDAWLTLTKTGSCYDITTYTEVLSVNKDTLCPGDWVNIRNTALSSVTTLYYQQTGSSIMTLDPTVVEGERPSPLSNISGIIGKVAVQIGIRTFNWLAKGIKDDYINLLDITTSAEGSDNVPDISEECAEHRAAVNAAKKKLNDTYNALFNSTEFSEWSDNATAFQEAQNEALGVYLGTGNPTPCGGSDGSDQVPNGEELKEQMREVLKRWEDLME